MTIHHGAGPWNPSSDDPLPPSSMLKDPELTTSMLLTAEQAAEYLQVSLRTVKNLMSDGQLAYIKVGRATRIHRNDLDEYVIHNRRKQRYGLRAS